MSRIIMTLFALTAFSFSVMANEAPEAAITALSEKFPKAEEITWIKESANNFRADFTLSGVRMAANFNEDGKWLQTLTNVTPAQTPDAVSKFIAKTYGNGQIQGVTRIERATLEVVFEVKVKTAAGIEKVRVTPEGVKTK